MTDWEHFLLYAIGAITFFEMAMDDESSTFTGICTGLLGFGCLVASWVWLLRDWGVIG